MNVEDLKKLLKENRIHFYSYWGKRKLIDLANINNLLPEVKEPEKNQRKNQKRKNLSTLIMND